MKSEERLAAQQRLEKTKIQEWNYIIHNWSQLRRDVRTFELSEMGIPPITRKVVWGLAVPNKLAITKDLYKILEYQAETYKNDPDNKISKASTLRHVDQDISRTFTDIGSLLGTYQQPAIAALFCEGSPLRESLRKVLQCFSLLRPDIGYVQGMSYVAGLLLMYFEEFQSFTILSSLVTSPPLLPIYTLNTQAVQCSIQNILQQLNLRFKTFDKLFALNLPKLAAHFKQLNIAPASYLLEWILTLFTKNLNPDAVSRIWDMLLIQGTAILKLNESTLLTDDLKQVYGCLKNLQQTDEELARTVREVRFPKHLIDEFDSYNFKN